MRVLATAAGSFSLAVFAANCIPLLEGALLPLSCALAALCAVALLCLRGRARVRGALICGGLALGLLWTAAYGAVFYAPARALDDRTIRLSGTVMEYPQETDYGWSVLVRADGEPGAPVPTLVYADEQGADLRPGDRVETVAHCTVRTRRRIRSARRAGMPDRIKNQTVPMVPAIIMITFQSMAWARPERGTMPRTTKRAAEATATWERHLGRASSRA